MEEMGREEEGRRDKEKDKEKERVEGIKRGYKGKRCGERERVNGKRREMVKKGEG